MGETQELQNATPAGAGFDRDQTDRIDSSSRPLCSIIGDGIIGDKVRRHRS